MMFHTMHNKSRRENIQFGRFRRQEWISDLSRFSADRTVHLEVYAVWLRLQNANKRLKLKENYLFFSFNVPRAVLIYQEDFDSLLQAKNGIFF
jgi:hypothetical protein